MNRISLLLIVVISGIILLSAFVSDERSISFFIWDNVPSDTIYIGNQNYSNGSVIMTDQDAFVCIPPQSSELHAIDLFFSSFTTRDSLRVLVKSKPSYSCPGIGGIATPFGNDQYFMGWSKNILPDSGWNTFVFVPPLPMTADTIFVWPDLIQQVYPRVNRAATTSQRDSIFYLNGIYCGNGIVTWDLMSEARFTQWPPCDSNAMVIDDSNSCIVADTISSTAMIAGGENITYNYNSYTLLEHPFEIANNATLEINFINCRD
jgi:hypothetical protein